MNLSTALEGAGVENTDRLAVAKRVARPSSSTRTSARRRVLMVVIDLVVPTTVFAMRVGVWTLNPWAAPRMLSFDWVTYITAPNALRTAPIWTFPLGRTPAYIAPVGSSLGLSDASPYMLPVYRLLNAISPDRPTQILGWLLLASYILTYYWSTKFLRQAYKALRHRQTPPAVEIAIRIAGCLLLALPFYTTRISHVALTQQWILIVALYIALFFAKGSKTHDHYVVAVCLGAAVLHPYFVPPVAVISAPYVVRRIREQWRRGVALGAAIASGTLVIALMLGYLTIGTSTTNGGFGDYAADLLAVANAHETSRLIPGFDYAPPTWEGIGFVGIGVLLVVAAVVIAVLVTRWRPRPNRPLLAITACCLALALFATWPTVHAAGRTLADFSDTPLAFNFVGDIFRTNGRFVWSLSWLIALGACALVIAAPWRPGVSLIVLFLAASIQLIDVRPSRFVESDPAVYGQVVDRLFAQQANGGTRVEVHPPWIQYSCISDEIPYHELAPVLLASAVLRIPINSGYPGRPDPDFNSKICAAQSAAFTAGNLSPSVIYVLNPVNPMVPALTCGPLTGGVLLACRAPS